MNAVAQKCEKCKRMTLDSSGLCSYHRTAGLTKVPPRRAVPTVKSGTSIDTEKSYGWLTSETGIEVSAYSNGSSMVDLTETEQFAQWMKARVTVRAIESVFAKGGVESARVYAERADDTSLALIWERMNNSNMSEFNDQGMREGFIDIVRQVVESRVDTGDFSPLDVTGYVEAFRVNPEPQGSATFF